MKTMTGQSALLALGVLGVLTALGGQAQAGSLPACTQAEVDFAAWEMRVAGNFQRCKSPSVWLGQADGSYQSLGPPLETSKDFVLAKLTEEIVDLGTTQNVVVKCGKVPRCEIDVAFMEDCEDCDGPPAPVAKTGQTACTYQPDADQPEVWAWDNACAEVTRPPGQDGELQAGVALPNPRFTDNSDGTVTDNLTGLIWLKNANCFGTTQTWTNALAKANALYDGCTNCGETDNDCGLGDSSAPGNWRLPNIRELQSLVHYGYTGPALSDAAGMAQWTEGDAFSGVQSNSSYWSSTSLAGRTEYGWALYLYFGNANPYVKSDHYYFVWPVRGGQ